MKNLNQQRFHEPNSIHHVMMRGNNRQNIFYSEDCFDRFLKILNESTEKFDHKILAYCLMTNHIHLIVHVKKEALSVIMKNINFRYARWANKKFGRIGHLFQGRYRSISVNNEEYLINLCRYIHFNPVSARMTKKPDNYFWSSHQFYISNYAPDWVDLNIINEAIKNKTGLDYFNLIKIEPEREKWKPAFYLSDNGKFIIDDSIMKIKNASRSEIIVNPCYLSTDLIENIFSKYIFFDKEELYGPSKNHDVSKKRALLISYFLRYSDKTPSEIANIFHRTPSTLHRQVTQLTCDQAKIFSDVLLKKIDMEIQERMIN